MKTIKNIQKQLRCLYVWAFAGCLHPTDAVWVALLAARGFSLWQIGLAEGVFHVVSLLGEVPSGMAADLLGRRRTLAAGAVLGIVYALLMAHAAYLPEICLALGLRALAYNLCSGTEEAMTFDSLRAVGRDEEYLRVSGNIGLLQQLATALGSLTSLLEKALHYAGFYFVSAAADAAALLAALGLEEPIVTEEQAARETAPLREWHTRLAAHARAAAEALRQCPAAVRLIAADAVVSLPSYLTLMLLQQRLAEQGWRTAWLFVPMLLANAAGMAGTALAKRLRPHGLRGLFAVCALACGAGTILTGAAPAWGGVLGVMLVQAAINLWLLHALHRLQRLIPGDRRATLLSADSMAYSLLMIPASPLIGLLGDVTGHVGAGLCLLGACVCAAGLAGAAKRS